MTSSGICILIKQRNMRSLENALLSCSLLFTSKTDDLAVGLATLKQLNIGLLPF